MIRHLNPSPTLPRRVVVLGSAGFLGGTLVKRLAMEGIPHLALARADVDLLSPDAPAKLGALLESSDAVVAVAAMAPVKNSRMLSDNLRLVANMIDAISKSGVAHVINISSDAVYADGPLPLTESSPTVPSSLHGAMHLSREIAFAAEANAPLLHLRPTLVYGANDPHNGYGPNRFRRLADEGRDIVLFGEGEERRDHIHVDDVAALIVRALRHKTVGMLNAVTGQVHSFADIAQAVVTLSGKSSQIRTSPRIGAMPHNGYRPFDNAACGAAFPDFCFTSLTDGLKKAAAR